MDITVTVNQIIKFTRIWEVDTWGCFLATLPEMFSLFLSFHLHKSSVSLVTAARTQGEAASSF